MARTRNFNRSNRNLLADWSSRPYFYMLLSTPRRVLVVLCALTVAALRASAADTPPKLRLAEVQNVSPISYKVELSLDPEKDDFTGTIVIKLDVQEPTQTIWLNRESITVETAALTNKGRR